MKRKSIEESSLTREEACYEKIEKLFRRGSKDTLQFSRKEASGNPDDFQRIAQECPGAFRLKDRRGHTLLHHACYSEVVTVEILAILYEMNPDAFNESTKTEDQRTPMECMTYNMHAPHDAFLFLMEKAKPMRDPYDFYLELRFLCKNKKFPVTASTLRGVVEACPDAVSMTIRPEQTGLRYETPLCLLCANETATLEAVSYLHEVGDSGLPLHEACSYGLSSEIILFLTQKHPEALQVDHFGTPLHNYLEACLHRMQRCTRTARQADNEFMLGSEPDIEVVRRFVDIYPQALQVRLEDKGTPLHILIQMLRCGSDDTVLISLIQEMVRISPAVLQVQGGSTYPLVHALCSIPDPPIALVEALVDTNPLSLTLPTTDAGELPIHAVCKRCSQSTQLLKCIIDRASGTAMIPTAEGSLPIHLLLRDSRGVPLEALQLLVECNSSMLDVPHDNSGGDLFSTLDLPIHLACQKYGAPTLEVVRYLVTKYPESTTVRNTQGCSPLDCAIANRHQDTVDFLLNENPDVVTKKTIGGVTSFHRACRHGSLETIQKIYKIYPTLIQQADEKQRLPLLYAIGGNQDEGVLAFLLKEFSGSVVAKDKDGFLPFHAACQAEDPNMWLIKILFKVYPSAIHTTTNDGKLPIQILCEKSMSWRDLEVLSFLACQLPYSVGLRDAQGRCPLHLFCQRHWSCDECEESRETLKKLHDSNPDAIRHDLEEFGLPIHCACKAGCCLDVLKYLVELFPESLNHRHKSLGLPLHCYNGNGDKLAFEFLLEKRYGTYIEEHGRFLLHALLEDKAIDRKEALANILFRYAQDWYYSDYLERSSFKKEKTKIERSKDYQGRLPLHLAVSGGLDEEFTTKLIEMYPDAISEKDRKGKLPLHHAFENGASAEIFHQLLERDPKTMTEADSNNCLPFHLGCQHHREQGFMEICDDQYFHNLNLSINAICQKAANNGDLPLHKACIGGNLNCISSLVAAYPLALRTPNHSDMVPVFLLCQPLGKDKVDFEEREERYIGAIFDLLRRNPEAILVQT